MSFPYDRSPNDPKAIIQYGRDFNYFTILSVSNTTFNADADVVITFPTNTTTFQLQTGGGVQYSFNGVHVHGTMDAATTGLITSNNLIFVNRPICKIWFLASGASTVRIEAWGNP